MNVRRVLRFCLVLGLVVALLACTSREEKSQKRFQKARQVELAGQVEQAEALYKKLVAAFPDTPGAVEAKQRLEEIALARHLSQQKDALPLFKGIQEVLAGYVSLYGRPPGSFRDLDDGSFFFDSDYLGEGVPAGFTAYLAFDDSRGGYRIWVFPEKGEVGFHVEGSGLGLSMQPKKDLLAEIRKAYVQEVRKGRLTYLVPGTAAAEEAVKAPGES